MILFRRSSVSAALLFIVLAVASCASATTVLPTPTLSPTAPARATMPSVATLGPLPTATAEARATRAATVDGVAQRMTAPTSTPAEGGPLLRTLKVGHPRLLLTDARLEGLKALHETDETLQRFVRDVARQADDHAGQPMLQRELIGPRLLHISRAALQRVYTLAFMYRWTGEARYADKAIENLRAVCAFSDWNPSHFLDVAEMTHAVGIGYDWLYDYMDVATRDEIRTALIRHGLEPGLVAYRTHWFPHNEYNWNQVCNGGLVVGALAVAETDPRYADDIIAGAIESLPRALASYAPDGVWMEGPSYWHYATSYTAYSLAALQTALGTDFGLSDAPGLAATGYFPIFASGPNSLYLNFADAGSKSRRGPMGCMFWLAQRYGDANLADAEHEMLKLGRASVEHVIWYVPPSGNYYRPAELDRLFRGDVPVAVLRGGWGDRRALFVGIKGGFNQVNHGHLDLGSFELDALGQRWALDLGSDDYNLLGYWDGVVGGQRWSYYRLNSQSHNVPLINDRDQRVVGVAREMRLTHKVHDVGVVIDLSDAYRGMAESLGRGVALVGGRRAVLVQDEITLAQPADVAWGMTTEAEIKLLADGSAELTLQGEKMRALALSPAGAALSVESAEQEPPQLRNRGVRRLMVRLSAVSGDVRIAVLLSPVWPDGRVVTDAALIPLGEW